MSKIWTRLNKEEASQALDRISDSRDAILFGRDTSQVSHSTLPFYKNFKLCRITNYATMPVFTLVYLTDEHLFVQLDGTGLEALARGGPQSRGRGSSCPPRGTRTSPRRGSCRATPGGG